MDGPSDHAQVLDQQLPDPSTGDQPEWKPQQQSGRGRGHALEHHDAAHLPTPTAERPQHPEVRSPTPARDGQGVHEPGQTQQAEEPGQAR